MTNNIQIPASVLLGCYFYTFINYDRWNESWLVTKNGQKYGWSSTCDIDQV